MAAKQLGEESNTILLEKAMLLSKCIQENLRDLMQEWREFMSETSQPFPVGLDPSKHLIVERSDMEQLVSEAMMMKEFLPTVLGQISLLPQLNKTEQELISTQQLREKVERERDQLACKADNVMADYEHEKQEKFAIKCSLTDLNQQLQQQIEYCASLGSVCGTLLWRTSQNEDCIHNLLSGSRVNEFLQLVTTTLHSYLATYQTELPCETSQESQFVLSLCGIVTNIAASAYGRDYLSSCSDGQSLLENMCSILATAPVSQECSKLKNLILMLLYNISINQKGLTVLRTQPELLRVIVWLTKEESSVANKILCLQLLQSLILEPLTPALRHQAIEAISVNLLQQLASSTNNELKQLACELMIDLQQLHNN